MNGVGPFRRQRTAHCVGWTASVWQKAASTNAGTPDPSHECVAGFQPSASLEVPAGDPQSRSCSVGAWLSQLVRPLRDRRIAGSNQAWGASSAIRLVQSQHFRSSRAALDDVRNSHLSMSLIFRPRILVRCVLWDWPSCSYWPRLRSSIRCAVRTDANGAESP
jgi:hypothetical protein